VPHEQKKEAEEKFKEISEAYAVLSDSQKRALYDQYGHSGIDQRYGSWEDLSRGADWSVLDEILRTMGSRGGMAEQIMRMVRMMSGDIDFSEEDMFGEEEGFTSVRTKIRGRGRDLEYGLEISLEEAAFGVEKKIEVQRYELCKNCNGSGLKPGEKIKKCSRCRGTGQIQQTVRMGPIVTMTSSFCPKCRGEGSVIEKPCPSCGGEGRTKVIRKIEIKIPAGVDTGSHLRIRGEGEAGTAGRGDLYVIIEVIPHPIFERHNNDILTKKTISLSKAILGGEVEVSTLDGKVNMKIPAGTQSGRIFRLKDKGIPDLHGKGNGDELVRVEVEIPTHLTSQQRQLIEELARLSGEDVSK
jgi:molecular chaperone DnaJ